MNLHLDRYGSWQAFLRDPEVQAQRRAAFKDEHNKIATTNEVFEQLKKLLPGLPERVTELTLRLTGGASLPEVTVTFYPGANFETVTKTFRLEPQPEALL